MEREISKTQIDRLGDRLRKGNITDSDLRLLDEYRRSFSASYGVVAGAIRHQLELEPTGRPAKSTTSIADKLLRESIRLSQIQDIAGCRLIVSDLVEQDRVIASLTRLFPHCTVIDRREKPSHGYRAVHIVVKVDEKGVEIQVRTKLQQLWAEFSEKLSDLVNPTIKYGGGNPYTQELLARTSKMVANEEQLELDLLNIRQTLPGLTTEAELTHNTSEAIMNLRKRFESEQQRLIEIRREIVELFQSLIENPPRPV
jgi:putative GTP pyrophosphokinase